jgi:hypothetical protein
MGDITSFLWAVLNNWAGYSTGGLIVAAIALWAVWRNKPLPRRTALLLAVLFLFMAFYKAWHDQYVENAVSRETGSLAFVALGGELNRHADLADPQLDITFRNLQPRLIEYNVDDLSLEIGSQQQEQIFINRGGYIYAGLEGHYRLHYVQNVPIENDMLSGVLMYNITYHIVGSKVTHHSAKRIAFDLQCTPPLSGKFSTLDEHED